MGVYIGTNELKNAYIGECRKSLEKIFDFSVDTSYGDYSYVTSAGNGLTIDTTNGWCVNNNWGNGSVFKRVDASEVWTRVKFNFKNISISSNNGGGICMFPFGGYGGVATSDIRGVNLDYYNNIKQLHINLSDSIKTTATTTIGVGADYYLDFKFENGILTGEILDLSGNVITSTTYTDTSITTIPYIGFATWCQNLSNSYGFVRVREFWEWHK